MQFLVKYQSTPFAHTRANMLKIEAPDKVHAWVVAYDRLVSTGYVVESDSSFRKIWPDADEARIAAQLSHPHIVPLYSADATGLSESPCPLRSTAMARNARPGRVR